MDSKICRICLGKTATVYLFDKHDGIQHSNRIMHCVSIVITDGDGFPDKICTTCAEELYVAYKFVIKCEASDKILRETNIAHIYDVIVPKEESKIKLEDLEEVPTQIGDDLDQFLSDDHKYCDAYDIKKRIPRKKYKKREKNKIDRRKLRPKMGPFSCNMCGQVAPSHSALESHIRTHTGEKPFICHYCNARFPLKGSLKRHIVTHHTERERQFICETCGNSFLTKNCIITHMRLHTDERPYTCPFCPKTFRQVASQIRHKRLHTGEKPYTCPTCFKKFSDKSHMKRHQAVHSDEKKFTCQLCNKAVKSKNSLITHMRIHSNEKHNVCSYCGMTFSMKGNLQTHIRRKHSEKSGVCDVCLKPFSDLEAHMRRHTGEKPLTCKLCNQAFFNKRSLSNHMGFRHDNAAKYKCTIEECTKTFPMATMLEFHLLKYHKNKTPYICQHCARGFYRSCDLSRHLKGSHMDIVKNSDRTLIHNQ